jgi:hypothetical protein
MIWLVAFFIAFIVFFTGKSTNNKIAIGWKKACNEVITQNFAHFGL